MDLLALLFKLSSECIDVLAWPVFAVGYPLFASIQAIETNSRSDTQKLISYWVCFSLILIFDHAFAKLLQWLPSWPFIKLTIICCLILPRFNGSFYMYRHLVHPCLSFTPQIICKWFIKPKPKKDGRLALKSKTESSETRPDAFYSLDPFVSFAANVMPMYEEAKVHRKEINSAPIMEKTELMTSTNPVCRPEPAEFALPGNRGSASVEIIELTDETVTGKQPVNACGNLKAKPEISSALLMKWNCPVCKITTKSKIDIVSHFQGKRHEDALEKLKIKIDASKSQISSDTDKTYASVLTGTENPDKSSQSTNNVQIPWTCVICRVTLTAETSVVSHLRGKRHKESCERVKAWIQASKTGAKIDHVSRWGCVICNVSCSSQGNMEDHLNGSKHLAKTIELSGNSGIPGNPPIIETP